MQVEVIVTKITHSNDHYGERKLVDHFCLADESNKPPTRTRIRKLMRRTFPEFGWYSFNFFTKDKLGHYHTMESGPRAQTPYHFWWYHFEIIPCTKTNDSVTTATSIPSIPAKIQVTNEILRGISKNVTNAIGINLE